MASDPQWKPSANLIWIKASLAASASYRHKVPAKQTRKRRTMSVVSQQKAGLMLGALLGCWHLIWAIVVGSGWGQPLLDFVFWMHFIKPALVIDTFSIGRALVLITVMAAIGYCAGYLGALIWNRLHAR